MKFEVKTTILCFQAPNHNLVKAPDERRNSPLKNLFFPQLAHSWNISDIYLWGEVESEIGHDAGTCPELTTVR